MIPGSIKGWANFKEKMSPKFIFTPLKKPGNTKKKRIALIIIKEDHITSNKDDIDIKYCTHCNLLQPLGRTQT